MIENNIFETCFAKVPVPAWAGYRVAGGYEAYAGRRKITVIPETLKAFGRKKQNDLRDMLR